MTEPSLLADLREYAQECPDEDPPYHKELIDYVDELKQDNDELNALFELQHKRTREADALWQAATGNSHIMPDLGTLIGWLLERKNDPL